MTTGLQTNTHTHNVCFGALLLCRHQWLADIGIIKATIHINESIVGDYIIFISYNAPYYNSFVELQLIQSSWCVCLSASSCSRWKKNAWHKNERVFGLENIKYSMEIILNAMWLWFGYRAFKYLWLVFAFALTLTSAILEINTNTHKKSWNWNSLNSFEGTHT